MNLLANNFTLLADYERGIGLIIFFVIAGVMWVLGAIGKAVNDKKAAQARENFRQSTARHQPTVTNIRPQRKQKSTHQKSPPPVPRKPITTESIHTTSPVAAPIEGVVTKKPHSEIARNIRLMLTKSGAKEAIVLNEILGKPKGLE